LGERFDDFRRSIEFWKDTKKSILNSYEDYCDEGSFGIRSSEFLCSYENVIDYYIKKLKKIQILIGEKNHTKNSGTQTDSIIDACETVLSCEDDNFIFQEIFLMGQYTGNLNNLELNINRANDKKRSKFSAEKKSDWADELGQQVYLDHWIYGNVPTVNEVQKQYSNLVEKPTTRTITTQLANQRKKYSIIDNRVPQVTPGRNKKL